MGRVSEYPGNLKTFLLTFTAINPAYNGAWWFLTTYIILVLLSPYINKIVIKYNTVVIIGLSLIIYFAGYIQRIMVPIVTSSEVINYILRQAALFGTSQLPFIIGSIFAHRKLYSKIYNLANKSKLKNLLCISIIILMIIAHGFVQTLFVAVFTGIIFVVAFNLIDKPMWLDNLLSYLSKHSTNMWLVHMFFYMVFFKGLVYAPKYPILIFVWLVVLCLGASYIINLIYKPIISLLDKNLEKSRRNLAKSVTIE